MNTILTTITDVRALPRPPAPARRAVVMTMGALHRGHLALVTAARDVVGPTGQVLVTIFVNPLQFGDQADLETYPRTLTADVDACREEGVDVVFDPNAGEMDPAGAPVTRVMAGATGDDLEGAARPGHFSGMLTVVLKLLNVTTPDVALFGEKDYQQLPLIRQMVADFNIGVDIVGVPTCREPDGLAMSSRNVRLTAADRPAALTLSRALSAGQAAAADGGDAAAVVTAAGAELTDIDVDYLDLRSVDLGPPTEAGPARLLVAANVAGVRLLDNCEVVLRARGGHT